MDGEIRGRLRDNRDDRHYRDVTAVWHLIETFLDRIAGVTLAIRMPGRVRLALKK